MNESKSKPSFGIFNEARFWNRFYNLHTFCCCDHNIIDDEKMKLTNEHLLSLNL